MGIYTGVPVRKNADGVEEFDLVFQGELLVQRIQALPADLEEYAREMTNFLSGERKMAYVLGHSETGHHHVIEDVPHVKVFKKKGESERALFDMFVTVQDQPVYLNHLRENDQHDPIVLTPGMYLIGRQQEATPDGYRQVAD